MKKCNYCWSLNSDDAHKCSGCGANDFSPLEVEIDDEPSKIEQEVAVPKNTSNLTVCIWLLVIVLPVVLLFLSMMFEYSKNSLETHQTNQRNVIESSDMITDTVVQNAVEPAEEMLPPQPAFVTSSEIPTNTSKYGIYWRQPTTEDSYGDTHSGDIVRMAQVTGDVPSIEFITGGKYTKFTTTVFTTLIKEDHRFQFKVYADNILVYDTGFVDRTFKEETVEIDITGVYAIKMECYQDGYVAPYETGPSFCLQDMTFWF